MCCYAIIAMIYTLACIYKHCMFILFVHMVMYAIPCVVMLFIARMNTYMHILNTDVYNEHLNQHCFSTCETHIMCVQDIIGRVFIAVH